MAHDDDLRNVDTTQDMDDELCSLFSSFNEVSASDELKEATISRIFAAGAENDVDSPADLAEPSTAESITAIPGGQANAATRSSKRSRWRAIRIAAAAACLAMALTGGIAYATPASYYEVEQDGTTITLGVNCFGITIGATSDSETGYEIIEGADLRNMPYEDSVARAIDSMERRNPDKPVEFGPQGGERKVTNQQEPVGDTTPPDGGQPQNEGQQRDGEQPQGYEQPPAEDRPQGGDQPKAERDESPEGAPPSSQGPADQAGQPGNQAPEGPQNDRR